MALTFVRTSELIGARWSEFDMRTGRWDIPAERMKMKTPHIVALSTHAKAILKRLEEISFDRELVFPARRESEQADEQRQLATVGQMVAAGLGVSVVPSLCKQQVSALGARCLRLSRPSVRKPVGLITRSDQQLSTAASALRAAMYDGRLEGYEWSAVTRVSLVRPGSLFHHMSAFQRHSADSSACRGAKRGLASSSRGIATHQRR